MNIVRCDRCEKEIPSYDSKPIIAKEKRKFLLKVSEYEFKYDICEECYESFREWFVNNEEE